MADPFEEISLAYHKLPRPGKLEITPTKPMANARDLSQAYSPGVAFPCMKIKENPLSAFDYTARGNLVAVISNGTAVLGLGAIGALASKPVMEGKAVLLKKFAGIDCFDIELEERDPQKLIDAIAMMEPTFGAINLEDIKAPECFVVESTLRERMNIPVFHDDQHGTAIVAGAAIHNALKLVNKDITQIKLVSTGGGAASLACLDLAVSMGLKKENIILCDLQGVVYEGRQEDMNPYKSRYARDTKLRTLSEAIEGADVFLGLSGPGVLTPEMVKKMASQPIILAMANPTPEILPDVAREACPDAIIATGRSDYPNQVNNVLCFPFLFRGALDVGATTINEEMKMAACRAISAIAHMELTDDVAKAYQGEKLKFGPDYILPKPFDPRLFVEVSFEVAKTAMETGVATRPIKDLKAYKESLRAYGHRTRMFMQPIIDIARQDKERLVYAEGENDTVLMALQAVVDEKVASPILIGRPNIIQGRIETLGLRLERGKDYEIIEPGADPARDEAYAKHYHSLVCRRGVSVTAAEKIMRSNNTAYAATMVSKGDADAMICGSVGRFDHHFKDVVDIIGPTHRKKRISSMTVLVTPKGPVFISDAHLTVDPTADDIVQTTLDCAKRVRSFGLTPKVALLSHSNFGSSDAPSAKKMRKAARLLAECAPDLEVDGEMQANSALDEKMRNSVNPFSKIRGEANLMIMPNLDAANIALQLMKASNDSLAIGPILSGTAKSAHIVTPAATAKGIFNMTAIALADAWHNKETKTET